MQSLIKANFIPWYSFYMLDVLLNLLKKTIIQNAEQYLKQVLTHQAIKGNGVSL